MIPTPSISAALQQVTNRTLAALIADKKVQFGFTKQLYFRQGNLKEVNKQLTLAGKSPVHKGKRFPLIVLMRDFKETLEKGQYGSDASSKIKLLFFNLTQPDYSSDQREEKVFAPILRPIVSEFINQLSMSVEFGMPDIYDQMKPEKTECFFYGTSDDSKNAFGDYVDAIELDLYLSLKNNICPVKSGVHI